MSDSLSAVLKADNTQFVASMKQAQAEVKNLASSTRFIQGVANDFTRLQKSANDSSAGLAVAGKHMEQFGFHTAAAKRELVVLTHELSQGNYSRFGSSLLVLAERTGAASLLFSGFGVAALAATAAVGAFGAAAIMGARQSDELYKSLRMTGNYAGLTEGQFNAMADVISGKTVASVGHVRDAMQALVATGQVGPRFIAPMTEAVLRYAKTTGETEEAVAKDFAKMIEAPAKWAEEHNRSMHFASAAQMAMIRDLEEVGGKEQAAIAVLDELNVHLNTAASFWDKLRAATSGAWDEMLGTGRAETVEDRLSAVNKQLAEMDRIAKSRGALAAFSSAPDGPGGASRSDLLGQRDRQLRDQLRGVDSAGMAAENARMNAAADAARKVVDGILGGVKGQERLNGEIKKTRQLFADAAAAGVPYTDAQQRAALEQVRKRNRDPEAERLAAQAEKDREAYLGRQFPAPDVKSITADAVLNAGQRDLLRMIEHGQTSSADAFDLRYPRADAKGIEGYQRDNVNPQRAFRLSEIKNANEDFMPAPYKPAKPDALDEAMNKWLKELPDNAKEAEKAVKGVMGGMEDAIVKFAETGKLSFGSLWSFMADEFIRQTVRVAERDLLTDKTTGNFIGMAGLSSAFSSIGTAFMGMFGSHAAGLDSVPYDNYPALLHKGERVQTALEARSSSASDAGSVSLSTSIGSIGAGVSRAEMAAALGQSAAAQSRQLQRLRMQGITA